MNMVNVINKSGRVFQVGEGWEKQSYSPDKDGFRMVNVGGFGYDCWKNTDLPPTHKYADHPSLEYRGDVIDIDCKEYQGYTQE